MAASPANIWQPSPDDPESDGAPVDDPPFAKEITEAAAVLLSEGRYRDLYEIISEAAERTIIRQVLEHFHGNRVKTASALGISRNMLRRRMQALRIRLCVELRISEGDGGMRGAAGKTQSHDRSPSS